MIKQVYEADALLCPQAVRAKRSIAVIDHTSPSPGQRILLPQPPSTSLEWA